MLFTDGGEDRAQDVFMQYNWPNKTVSPDVTFHHSILIALFLTHCVCHPIRFECLHFLWASITMMSHLYSGLHAQIKVS